MNPKSLEAILLIYHHPVSKNAPTISEHVNSFRQYSQFSVISLNTEYGFDRRLLGLRFPLIVLHYSLFGSATYMLSEPWRQYLAEATESYKVAFFQDEYYFCPQRFAFIDRYGIDAVFTLYDPKYWDQVYRRHTKARQLVHTLTGYMSDDAIQLAQKYAQPAASRRIDIGYRARKLPFYMGRGAQEKWEIGHEFSSRQKALGLNLDISWREQDRIYGERWYKFLGSCKATLGVESGVSITDLDGTIYQRYQQLIAENPDISFEEMSAEVLADYEEKIPLRVISPRCFEAAAMRTCQIMFEGDYNGIMQPMVHYIPLKKDYSNFDAALQAFQNPRVREEIVDNAYQDLVASRRYSYQQFIKEFDQFVIDAGCEVRMLDESSARILQTAQKNHVWRGRRRWVLYVAVAACVWAWRVMFFFSWLLPEGLREWLKKRRWIQRILGVPANERARS